MASPQLENYVVTKVKNVVKELPNDLCQLCKREVTNARLDVMNLERLYQAVENIFSSASRAMGGIGFSGVLINTAVCQAAVALVDGKGNDESRVNDAVACFKKILDGISKAEVRTSIEDKISMAAEAVLNDSSITPVVRKSSEQAWRSFTDAATNSWFGMQANLRTEFDHIADALKNLPPPGCDRAKNYTQVSPLELGVLGQRESMGKMLFVDMINLKAFGHSIVASNLVKLLDHRIVCHREPKPLPEWAL